jgi:hypothetical protein
MKKLLLVALCSTSLLSVARAEGGDNMGSGNSMQQGDAMKAGDDAGHAGSMAPDSTQAVHKKTKKAKNHGAETQMKHDGMDHGSMQHDGQMDSGTK